MNQDEFLARIGDLDASLTDIQSGVDKVSADTDSLLMEVRALQEQIAAGPGTTPAIDAALAAVQSRVQGLSLNITALDAKVPDSVASVPPAPVPDPAPAPDPDPFASTSSKRKG